MNLRTARLFVFAFGPLLLVSAHADDEIVFCHAVVSRALSNEYEQKLASHQLNGDLMLGVRIQLLSVEDQQGLQAKYRDHPPRPRLVAVFQCAPMIPFDMRKQKIEGKADCYLIVGKDGMVNDVYLAGCTTKSYAQAFALSLRSWRFKRLDEECLIVVPMVIHLTDDNAAAARIQ
jgi:hypothetical protein